MTTTLHEAKSVLKRVFGYDDFIGKQAEVIAEVLADRSAMALMPTGGGKSLCYQIPALVKNGTAVVISPLIALMKDQVDSLQQHNVAAAYLNSSLSKKQSDSTLAALRNGSLQLLYISPERLSNSFIRDILHSIPLSLFAIDEAHCISQWGHDFRRDYLQLGELIHDFPTVPRLALTATADTQTRQEIIKQLGLENAKTIIASFDRRNIHYEIRQKANARQQFLSFYKQHHQNHSGIIYCFSRRRAEETAQWLEKEGIRALPYHAGMNAKIRANYQEIFIKEESVVMCATIAFGMGIDKPDVRFVAHFDLPKSIEGLYQETGRAGRDGLSSNALLFYGLGDAINIRRFINESTAGQDVKRIEHNKLDALLSLCESSLCRRHLLLEYFGESYTAPCNNCDNCLTPQKTFDGTENAKKILSAMYRTQQTFGAVHIIDVLCGKSSEKVTRFSHDQLPTFGVGKNQTIVEWRRYIRQMIATNTIYSDNEHGALKIGVVGWEILKNKQTIEFTASPVKTTKDKVRQQKSNFDVVLNDDEQAIFNKLREKRQLLSRQQNVPAYIIFNDAVLIDLARIRPLTHEDFITIPGVGIAKVERYADDFIRVLKNC